MAHSATRQHKLSCARYLSIPALMVGLACAQQQCAPACQHGLCQQQFNSQSYHCNCTGSGFTGIDCSTFTAPSPAPTTQQAASDSPCSPACTYGVCRQQFNPGSYRCDCRGTGFTGISCATLTTPTAPAPVPQAASSSPCSPACQHGLCKLQFNSQSYACECEGIGYTGIDCSTARQPAPAPAAPQGCSASGCLHGTCQQAFNSQQYSCSCSSGWTGAFCNVTQQTAAVTQKCSAACENGGSCQQVFNSQSYYCKCPAGFTGSTCSQETASAAEVGGSSSQQQASGHQACMVLTSKRVALCFCSCYEAHDHTFISSAIGAVSTNRYLFAPTARSPCARQLDRPSQ